MLFNSVHDLRSACLPMLGLFCFSCTPPRGRLLNRSFGCRTSEMSRPCPMQQEDTNENGTTMNRLASACSPHYHPPAPHFLLQRWPGANLTVTAYWTPLIQRMKWGSLWWENGPRQLSTRRRWSVKQSKSSQLTRNSPFPTAIELN